jgi:predicted MFS family arabinose efflux permease
MRTQRVIGPLKPAPPVERLPADRWDWHGVFLALVVCCVLTMVFSAFTLGHKAESQSRSAHSHETQP